MPKPSGFTYERRRAMRELGKLLKAENEGGVMRALVDDLRASFGGPVPQPQSPEKIRREKKL